MNKLINQQTVKEIFWDRPEMTPEILMGILENPASAEYYNELFSDRYRTSNQSKEGVKR